MLRIKILASSQVSSALEQPHLHHQWRPRSDFEPLSIRFKTAFDPIGLKPGSESDQKRLKIRSGTGLVRKGGALKLGLDLAGPNISSLEDRNTFCFFSQSATPSRAPKFWATNLGKRINFAPKSPANWTAPKVCSLGGME